jgi:multidrug efflux pump subunit AcrA (membrane-fusion protein)
MDNHRQTAMKKSLAILALTLSMGLSGCAGTDHVSTPTSQAPIAVTVTTVAAIDTRERLEAGGVVTSQESAVVSSRIVATIAGVRVAAGDHVRAGDLLVTLDARDVAQQTTQARAGALAAEKALARARAETNAAEAEHRLAMAWHKRIASLHARNSATDQERDEADARLSATTARLSGAHAGIEGAEAHVDAARAAAGSASVTESFTIIRAPFNGLVTERLLDAGNLAAPGVPILRLESDGPRQVVVRVDEARAGYVQAGDRVRVVIDSPGEPAGGNDVEGVVTEVGRAIGATQRAFTVKAAIPSTVRARSGSFARIVFRGPPRRALVVPADAVQRHGQVSSVYVVQDGVARLRLIQTGEPLSDGVEVLSGIDAGESIVTSPLPRLIDGAPVTVTAVPARSGGAS